MTRIQNPNQWPTVLLVLIPVLLASTQLIARETSTVQGGRHYAELLRTRCGPRAAWAFSLICGRSLDHDRTMAAFSTQDDAVSLGDIALFLKESGIECELRCLSPTDLSQVCPAVVYLSPATSRDEFGHFVVVLETDIHGVTLIEPQIGRRERWTWNYFSDRWTGRCIFASRGRFTDRWILWSCVLVNLVSILCFIRR